MVPVSRSAIFQSWHDKHHDKGLCSQNGGWTDGWNKVLWTPVTERQIGWLSPFQDSVLFDLQAAPWAALWKFWCDLQICYIFQQLFWWCFAILDILLQATTHDCINQSFAESQLFQSYCQKIFAVSNTFLCYSLDFFFFFSLAVRILILCHPIVRSILYKMKHFQHLRIWRESSFLLRDLILFQGDRGNGKTGRELDKLEELIK